MPSPLSPSRYCVVALLAPMGVGDRVPRSAWPAHVTLASNFLADASTAELVEILRSTGAADEAMTFRLGDVAMFGSQHDIAVRLVESARAIHLHGLLTDRLEKLVGFAADEPAHWRGGFRPHLTLGPAVCAVEGEMLRSTRVGIARIDGAEAELVAALDIE
ncbi:2'-5' RNA ligase family protein [Microbacterium sp. Kw_RZR3]|uniref:2'-5' RNA ligase family protein n=1 Tax=Microbacterium sp. Kw_RZR3 TaxID=3032903 RepID=UPI0023DCB23D|nr:2'-5' RNA ligase family protein [Microbacterium sp. Kw_RZR3]MDF2047845.1 2'-5' RNA ligase family protein [Microbacterium sp. Kw_RZR3]